MLFASSSNILHCLSPPPSPNQTPSSFYYSSWVLPKKTPRPKSTPFVMGASHSGLDSSSSSCFGDRSLPQTGLGDLPEACVALIIENLDPVEICGFSKLSRAFRGASWADFIWESKLPPNYKALLEKVFDGYPPNLQKRDVYVCLSRVNSFDEGTKKVWLEKRTGGVCLSISAKGLSITGIDDRRYWNHIPTDESRFSSVAYLQQTWWFEVNGEIDFPLPVGSYSIFFRLQLGQSSKWFGRRFCNTEQVHGWDIKPVRFQLWTEDGQYSSSQCMLTEQGNWNHYHAGDFVVKESKNSSTKIKFSMTQIDCTHTKGGLSLDSVIVYPTSCKDRLKPF